MSSSTTPLTVSMGTANPTPWATPWEPAEATWELIPITVPRASKSGPPELPELMAASVWTALSMVKLLGASIGRPSPLTIPVLTLMPTLSGLPMAITGSPTPNAPESPSVSGRSKLSGASTWMTATSVEGSSPTSSAGLLTPLANLTEISSAPSTTCWLVTMCPPSSSTNPEPPPGPVSWDVTSTLTTPGPSSRYTSRTESPSSPMEADSEGSRGAGACFIVTSPVPPPATGPAPRPPPSPEGGDLGRLRRRRALLYRYVSRAAARDGPGP